VVPDSPASPPLHLDDGAVARLLDPVEVVEAQDAAFAALGRGEAATTTRVRAAAPAGMASAMAAVVPGQGVSGGKLYATVQGRFTFLLALFDLDGRLLATLAGDELTRARTPAASAIAVRRLARPGADTAAIVGTGRQTLGHARMLARELPLRSLRIAGRNHDRVDAVVAELRDEGLPAHATHSPDQAVHGADVVVTLTAADHPLFSDTSVSDGTLICAVGATKATRRELPGATVARSAAVVCDDVEGSRHECGDLVAAADEGHFDWHRAIDLAPVCAGLVDVPHAGDRGPVLFETQGVAIQDVSAAALAYRRHLAERA
jgi:ornithine cyclodeaminase/alanine dehydrogenase-like protein (mu-crystallin family)